MLRPSRTACTMVAKLSSAKIIFAASLLTSVPLTPMAMPMSAAFSAGASFTPSPVMATTLPSACSTLMMRSLWAGATRAKTDVWRTAFAKPASSSASNSVPVSALAPGSTIPKSSAMRAAVRGWSPVIMMTRIPARRASAMASAAWSRGGSIMPTTPARISACSRSGVAAWPLSSAKSIGR